MINVWITTTDGDLLRADWIRQINVVGGLRAVTAGGSQFLIADVEGRQSAMAVARGLASAIADADTWSQAAEIDVVHEDTGWEVRTTAMAAASDRSQQEKDD